ncbi:ORF1237 [White spot syndrome virus]|uniref:Wsv041 n=3 Tax=White spot syndrome virus TaxID=342409 RepID=Q8VBC5_WSSVS|nr:wsv041 [Shrimp white spot syndrome virus]AFX59418.1 wsv041 [White spot syndrome virus]AAL33045.1 wsv041 [Shrimp white spot syndrome virus]AAL88966.1 WSSV098 [Shrimp white spot syndrome virus]ATU84228.1 ORF1237 [White spot syndrome virus]AWQ60230.1 wsv041 [Shrimp white spot syndrome virus]
MLLRIDPFLKWNTESSRFVTFSINNSGSPLSPHFPPLTYFLCLAVKSFCMLSTFTWRSSF